MPSVRSTMTLIMHPASRLLRGLILKWHPSRYPNLSILSSTGSEDRIALMARSTNTAWSRDVDEVFGTHTPAALPVPAGIGASWLGSGREQGPDRLSPL